MTAMLIDLEPTSAPTLRPRRTRGDRVRPKARPTREVSAPAAVLGSPHACTGEQAISVTRETVTSWRLTERGLAVVMVMVSMIALAALTVVGLTALQVTSPNYQPYGQSALSR